VAGDEYGPVGFLPGRVELLCGQRRQVRPTVASVDDVGEDLEDRNTIARTVGSNLDREPRRGGRVQCLLPCIRRRPASVVSMRTNLFRRAERPLCSISQRLIEHRVPRTSQTNAAPNAPGLDELPLRGPPDKGTSATVGLGSAGRVRPGATRRTSRTRTTGGQEPTRFATGRER
jgi:hypothetical protein